MVNQQRHIFHMLYYGLTPDSSVYSIDMIIAGFEVANRLETVNLARANA